MLIQSLTRSHCAILMFQQRHDLLMKFYALVQQHTDDLAKILVCLFLHLVIKVFPLMYINVTDTRKWKGPY